MIFVYLLLHEARRKDALLVATALLICCIKEVYALTAVMMGVVVWLQGRRRAGVWIIGLSGAYFLFATQVLIPHFTGARSIGNIWQGAFGYLGETPLDMAKAIVFDPAALLAADLFAPRKLLFVAVLLTPFFYVLWFAPLALLPAIPTLAVMALSRNVNHAYLGHQYTAVVTVTLLGGCIIALRRMKNPQWRRRAMLYSAAASFATLVLFGPAPIVSRLFWSEHAFAYQAAAYWPDARSRQIVALIEQHIPADPGVVVSVQNSINLARINQRAIVFAFPQGIAEPERVLAPLAARVFSGHLKEAPGVNSEALARRGLAYTDYVVVDSRRPLSLEDAPCPWNAKLVCADAGFRDRVADAMASVEARFDRVVEHDGFAIYRRKPAAP